MGRFDRYILAGLVSVPLVFGCGADDANLDESTAADGSGEDGSGATGASGETGDTGETFEGVPARGDIALTEVVVNQAVDVAIAVDGVAVAERNSYLVSGRDTLLRAYWAIPEDWQPRAIEARLELGYPDGTTRTLSDVKQIDQAAFVGSLDRSWWFAIPGADLPAGVSYHLSLWEATAEGAALPESTTILEAPIGGPQPLGVEPEPAELKVVVFPVIYDNGAGCSTDTSMSVTTADEQLLRDYLYERFPVQTVSLDFRRDATIVHTTPFQSLSELFPALDQRRADLGAAPNEYYYALVDICATSLGGVTGIAPITPEAFGESSDTKDYAHLRIAVGVWTGDETGPDTMAHELGHNHGLSHVACPVPAGGPDPAFPYPDGKIGVWGFGLRSFELRNPNVNYDLMSYCGPEWVADWTWSKMYRRVRTLTSWDYEGADADATVGADELLVGLRFTDGRETWWTTVGERPPEYFRADATLRFDYADGSVEVASAAQTLDDGTIMIEAQVPRPFTKFEAVTHLDAHGGHAVEVDRRASRRLH